MNRYLRKYLVLLSCTGACLLTACATTKSLQASTERLDEATRQFSSQIQYQGDDSRRDRVSRDAEVLAKAAHNLNSAVDKGDSRDDFDAEYRQVAEGYAQLHRQLADEGYAGQNQKVLADFDRVTTAYRSVEAGMSRR